MRRETLTSLARAVGLAAALFHATPVLSQAGLEIGRPTGQDLSPILTLDTERLLNDSAVGRAIDQDLADRSAALGAENREIEAQLTDEEKDLSDRRSSLTTEEFRAEATAFDEKVNRIREEQDAKLRDLQQQTEQARLTILQSANPVLASIMQDTGAVAILEKGSVIVALQTIDVTDLAIERLDAVMKNADPGVAEEGGAPIEGAPAQDAPTAEDAPAVSSPDAADN